MPQLTNAITPFLNTNYEFIRLIILENVRPNNPTTTNN